MSAVIDHDHAHAHHDHHGGYGGIMRWITTTNHKDIGTMYLWFSFLMFGVGGIMAGAVHPGLGPPRLQIGPPPFFHQPPPLHGLLHVFCRDFPAPFALAHLRTPLA